jgi:hypothetical protein
MPSILTINNVPGTNVFFSQPSNNSVLFASEIKNLITNPNFPSLFANTSIPNTKLQPIEGYNLAQLTLSGYSNTNPFAPGQLAPKTITSYNIARGAVGGAEGGVPPGTVIYWYGVPPSEQGGIPDGYLPADGSFLFVSDYPNLFAAISYRFGEDGSSKFRVPFVQAPAPSIALIKY